MFKRLFKNKKGAALVEYGLLIAGVALISSAAVSVFGHKTSDMIATVAAVMPGAHTDDNAAIISGKLIETVPGVTGASGATGIALNFTGILADSNTSRLGVNVGGSGSATAITALVVEAK